MKSILSSKTFWAGVFTALAPWLTMHGFELPENRDEIISAVTAIAGLLAVWYGRANAVKDVYLVPPKAPE